MTLQLQLRMDGNTMSFVVPAEAAAQLSRSNGELMSVTIERRSEETHEEKVQRQLKVAQSLMDRYDYTLRELAK